MIYLNLKDKNKGKLYTVALSFILAGALGNLIPPGVVPIVYGLATQTSIGKLFIGSVIPGIIVGWITKEETIVEPGISSFIVAIIARRPS